MGYETSQHLQALTELLIQAHPDGAKSSEFAEALGVTQQTIRNYLDRLSATGIPVQELEGRRYALDPRDYISPLQLTQAQAWFLYLLLRRIVRADLGRYALVNSLLRRLTASLHGELAEQLVPGEVARTSWDDILTTLVEGWRTQKLVRIQYRAPNTTAPRTHVIAPYWFEPAVWSDSNYLIAGRQKRDGTFENFPLKLDRVRSALLLSDSFERPSAETLLRPIEETWGIWDGEPVEVVLRFDNRVIDRLRETHWHPSQQMTIDGEGRVIWQARIAEPQEMLPWIRGWGADVEVLAPENLRTQIAAEAARTERLYEKDAPGEPPKRRFV